MILFIIGALLIISAIKQKKNNDTEESDKPLHMGASKFDDNSAESLFGLTSFNFMNSLPWWGHRLIKILIGLLFLSMSLLGHN